MRIRKATPADVITCARIQRDSDGARAGHLKKDELLSIKYLKRYLANDYSTILVAENGGEIAGHVVFSYDEWNNSAHIDLLFVRHDKQNIGIGSKLLDAVVKQAKKTGVRILFLETKKEKNNAIVFYEKNGFSVAGHIDGLYKEAPGNALVMSRKLKNS